MTVYVYKTNFIKYMYNPGITRNTSGDDTRISRVYQCTDNGVHGKRVAPLGVKAVIIMDDAGRNNAPGILRSSTRREFHLWIGRKAGRDVRVQ